MKKILVLILLGTIIFSCFKQMGNSFTLGWIAGMVYGLIADLIYKKDE